MPVAGIHGLAVTTVEGIGNSRRGLHAVQERLAKFHGSQCGFCTPGIVMSMYALLRNNPKPSVQGMDEYLQGLPDCTPLLPIFSGSQQPLRNCCMHRLNNTYKHYYIVWYRAYRVRNVRTEGCAYKSTPYSQQYVLYNHQLDVLWPTYTFNIHVTQ